MSAEVSTWSQLKRLWPWVRENRAAVWIALACSPLAMGLSMVQPLLVKRAIDDHIVPLQSEGLGTVAALYLGTVGVAYALTAGYTLLIIHAGQHSLVRLRESVYRHLITMAPRFFDKRPAGALLTRATSDVEAIGETLQHGVMGIVLDVLMMIGALGAMLWLDWRLSLLILAVSPPLLIGIELCRRALRKLYLLTREGLARVNGYLAERMSGMEIVQLFGHEQPTIKRFDDLNRRFRDDAIKANVFDAFMYALVDGVGQMCIAVMLWYGAGGLFGEAVSAGLLVAFVDYLERLFRPLREFSGKIAVLQRASAAMTRIFELLDDDDRIAEGTATIPLPSRGHVVYRDVRFGYGDDDVLHGISFELLPGEVVALVGPTGCGKTTLTRLLSRAYDGYRGSITMDGVELSSLKTDDVREHVAAVYQDLHLFPDTLRFNVTLGRAGLDDARLAEVAALVRIDDLVAQKGWDIHVREGGGNLSVGQGQLVTFGRAMAGEPTIVVLDEATASVDPVTEQRITEATEAILARKTVLVVAHRLATITAADRIVVLDAGRVVEQGTHAELLDAEGSYAALYRQGFAEAHG